MTSKKKVPAPPPSFESVISEIEAINSQLEAPNIDLNDALSLFEKGVQLTKSAQLHLSKAEQVVNKIAENNDGAAASTKITEGETPE